MQTSTGRTQQSPNDCTGLTHPPTGNGAAHVPIREPPALLIRHFQSYDPSNSDATRSKNKKEIDEELGEPDGLVASLLPAFCRT